MHCAHAHKNILFVFNLLKEALNEKVFLIKTNISRKKKKEKLLWY